MKKIVKWISIGIGIILVIFIGLIIYFVVRDLKQEEILKKEIVNYSNMDLLKDDFSIVVKTSGDYAYVEEAIKRYYKNLSDNIKTLNNYLSDKSFTNILSIENLIIDKPDFIISHSNIKKMKNKVNISIKNISKLCDEKTIKSLLDKNKLEDSEYYYDLYLTLMYTEQDIKELSKTKKDMENLSQYFNNYLDKVDEILTFLQKNDKYVQYSSTMIYFNSTEVLEEYKKLISELDSMNNQVSKENIDSNNDSI